MECFKQRHLHDHRWDPYVAESEEMVLGESLPLSELLLVLPAVSSAAAAIDISRSSSGIKHKKTHTLEVMKLYNTHFDMTT